MKKIPIKSKNGCIEIGDFLDLNLFEELIDFSNKNLDGLVTNDFKNRNIAHINKIIENKKFQSLTEMYTGLKFAVLKKKMTTNINTKLTFASSDTNLHYDKCFLNWVIPLQLGSKINPGLIIFPDSRKKIILFLILKVLIKMLGSSQLMRLPRLINLLGAQYIIYKPNHAYIFDGYNSLHGVLWEKEDGLRSVITINFSLQ